MGSPGPHPILTVGVLADTHIPDRARRLHPAILPLFQSAGVSHIIHGGDICNVGLLQTLSELAPVTAVRGNRDIFQRHLPLVTHIDLAGVRVGVTHGHGGLIKYLRDKVEYYRNGYSLIRYLDLLSRAVPGARVMIYGHTHYPETLWYRGILLFNPGSASQGQMRSFPPSVGLLKIYEAQRVEAELFPLEGYELVNRQWIEEQG